MDNGRDLPIIYDSHLSWVNLYAIRTNDVSQELDFCLFKVTLAKLDVIVVIKKPRTLHT